MGAPPVISDDFLKSVRSQTWPWLAFLILALVAGRIFISPKFGWLLVPIILVAGLYLWSAGTLWKRLGPRRWGILAGRKRTDQLRTMFLTALEKAEAPGLALVRVDKIGATRSAGVNAVVRHVDNSVQPAFFIGHEPKKHQVLLARVQTGNGAHRNKTLELFIGNKHSKNAVADILPNACWRIGLKALRPAKTPKTLPLLKPKVIELPTAQTTSVINQSNRPQWGVAQDAPLAQPANPNVPPPADYEPL